MATSFTQTVTTITLELTKDEAQTLATLLGYVGGSPTKSQRANTDNIRIALNDAGIVGVPYSSSANPVEHHGGLPSIIFKDE